MKRIFAVIICAILLCTFPIVAFAEDDTEAVTEAESVPVTEESITEPHPTEDPIPDETPSEDVDSTDATVTEEPTKTITDTILSFVKEHFGDISVVGSLLLAALYKRIKDKAIHKAIGTLNNNAVTIAESSNSAIKNASDAVTGYNEEIKVLLSEYRANAEEKKKLERILAEVQTSLKATKLANVELANEIAELLVLANIPNSKKEELYSRHLAAVGAIADAEKTEVIADDGQYTE